MRPTRADREINFAGTKLEKKHLPLLQKSQQVLTPCILEATVVSVWIMPQSNFMDEADRT